MDVWTVNTLIIKKMYYEDDDDDFHQTIHCCIVYLSYRSLNTTVLVVGLGYYLGDSFGLINGFNYKTIFLRDQLFHLCGLEYKYAH
jgi:hypothetical protein